MIEQSAVSCNKARSLTKHLVFLKVNHMNFKSLAVAFFFYIEKHLKQNKTNYTLTVDTNEFKTPQTYLGLVSVILAFQDANGSKLEYSICRNFIVFF